MNVYLLILKLHNIVLQAAYMAKIRKEFIGNPDFLPEKVANASSAAEGLCRWILAMEIYDRVAKLVAPKKIKLAEAMADLAETMAALDLKRRELKKIEDRLESLKQQFREKTDSKAILEQQVSMLSTMLNGFVYCYDCDQL